MLSSGNFSCVGRPGCSGLLPSQAFKTFKDGEYAVPRVSLLDCPGDKCFHIQSEPLVFQFLTLSICCEECGTVVLKNSL